MPSGAYNKEAIVVEAPASRSTKTTAVTLLIGIVIGLVAGGTWSGTHNSTAGQNTQPTTPATLQQAAAAAPQIDESDATIDAPAVQEPGMSVTVTAINAHGPVWAVVYENDEGVPGRVLGAGRFVPGRLSGTVDLARTTLPGLTYFVGLAADSADHTFSVKGNAPILDSAGNQIMTQFVVQ